MRSLGGYSCSSRLCGPEGGGAFSLAGVGHAEAFQPDQSAWHADPEVADGAACRERGAGRQHRCQTPGGGWWWLLVSGPHQGTGWLNGQPSGPACPPPHGPPSDTGRLPILETKRASQAESDGWR